MNPDYEKRLEYQKWKVNLAEGFNIGVYDGDVGITFKDEFSCNNEELHLEHNEGINSILLQKAIEGINKDQGKWRIIQADTHIRLYDSECGFNIPELICKFSEMSEDKVKESILEHVFNQEIQNGI